MSEQDPKDTQIPTLTAMQQLALGLVEFYHSLRWAGLSWKEAAYITAVQFAMGVGSGESEID